MPIQPKTFYNGLPDPYIPNNWMVFSLALAGASQGIQVSGAFLSQETVAQQSEPGNEYAEQAAQAFAAALDTAWYNAITVNPGNQQVYQSMNPNIYQMFAIYGASLGYWLSIKSYPATQKPYGQGGVAPAFSPTAYTLVTQNLVNTLLFSYYSTVEGGVLREVPLPWVGWNLVYVNSTGQGYGISGVPAGGPGTYSLINYQKSPYNAKQGDYILCDASAGPIQINFPAEIKYGPIGISVQHDSSTALNHAITIFAFDTNQSLDQPIPNNGTYVTSLIIGPGGYLAPDAIGMRLEWYNGCGPSLNAGTTKLQLKYAIPYTAPS